MYLCKDMTRHSFPEIGRRFGGRDHTTVLHPVRRIEELILSDAAFAGVIQMLKNEILLFMRCMAQASDT